MAHGQLMLICRSDRNFTLLKSRVRDDHNLVQHSQLQIRQIIYGINFTGLQILVVIVVKQYLLLCFHWKGEGH